MYPDWLGTSEEYAVHMLDAATEFESEVKTLEFGSAIPLQFMPEVIVTTFTSSEVDSWPT